MTQSQIELLLLLDENEMDIFTLYELKDLTSNKFRDINEIIENLVHKQLLSRIERGKYCRSNFRNEKVIGSYLVDDGVISYWSALNLHGLTEQFPNIIFIQTTKKKTQKSVFGVTYKFIRINPGKRIGISKEGYGRHSYYITDIEKTIVDCFDLPRYSGGYAELIKAFAIAELSGEKMIAYCTAVNNNAAIKRLGFLSELINKNGMKAFTRYAKSHVTKSYNLIDPLGSQTGSHNPEWKLRMNISQEEIMNLINMI